jgi:hypothetical protein
MVLGGESVAEELVVQVIPQTEDEFTCYSCTGGWRAETAAY